MDDYVDKILPDCPYQVVDEDTGEVCCGAMAPEYDVEFGWIHWYYCYKCIMDELCPDGWR